MQLAVGIGLVMIILFMLTWLKHRHVQQECNIARKNRINRLVVANLNYIKNEYGKSEKTYKEGNEKIAT